MILRLGSQGIRGVIENPWIIIVIIIGAIGWIISASTVLSVELSASVSTDL